MIEKLDKAKNMLSIFNSLSPKHKCMLIVLGAFFALQGLWFSLAFYTIGTGEGTRGFLNSIILGSVTHAVFFYPLMLIDLLLFVFMVWCSCKKSSQTTQPQGSESPCNNDSLICKNYPQDKWNMCHGDNIYTLTYETREKAIYEKKVNIIPIKDSIREFMDGTYSWTGDKKISPCLLNTNCHLEPREDLLRTAYYLRFDSYTKIEKNKPIPYTIRVDLEDYGHKAKPLNTFIIWRPAKSVTFVVKIHKEIPTKNNFFAVSREEYGENDTFWDESGNDRLISEREGDYDVYSYTFQNPRLICEYGIKWEWDE